MGDLEIFRSFLKYEMLLHKIKMKHDPPDNVEKDYTSHDLYTANYNIMMFHRSMLRKDNSEKKDFLKMMRNLVKIKIRAIKKRT